MEINIDFLTAGCNTRCRHCYVNGGPGPRMSLDDVLICLERLDAIAALLPKGAVSFTLDHEPMNHPQAVEIIRAASQTSHILNDHHGMTTGIGLMERADRDAVVRAYMECGYQNFGITIHGNGVHHDEIVRRKGAYAASVAAAAYLKAQGAKVEISLMLNRFFAEDASEISRLLHTQLPDWIYFAIPIFTPHANMLDFEPYRASLKTVRALRGYLTDWRQNEPEILNRAKEHTAAAALVRLKAGPSLKELFAQPQTELYLTLHPDCLLYVGNTGAETSCMGDLRRLDPRETAERIQRLSGNRDYGAYYESAALPTDETLEHALKTLPQDAVYGDFESVLYRGLAELRIPTKMMR